MASSDGKLVFPIRFDLEAAVRQATGDMDKVLRQMQATINSRPLSIIPTIDDKGLKEMSEKLKNLDIPQAGIGSGKNRYTAAEGSINALSAAIQKCIKEWGDLAETERITSRETGEYTKQAKDLIERFAALTAASESFGKTLPQIIADNKRAVAEEEKLAKKRAETAEKLTKLNNPNMSSLTEVQDSQKYFEKLAKSADVFSAGWSICIEKVKTLREQSKWLTENFKAFSAKDVFNLPEGNLTEIKDKVKALKIQMNAAVPDSAAWDAYAKELSRVKGIQAELEAQQKEATKTESQLRAEREAAAAALKKVYDEANTEYQRMRSRQKANYDAKKESGIAMKNLLWGDPKTLDEYNAKISALQSKLATLKPGSERFAKFNTELEKTKKALSDVNEALAQPKIKADKYANLQREVAILQGEERTIDQVNAKLRIRHEWLSKADVGSRSFRRNSEEIARLNKVMDELNAKSREYMRVSIAPMPERSIGGIQAKLDEYRRVMQETDFGSSAYKDAEAAAMRLTTKLEKMNKEAAEVEKWRVFQLAIRQSSATIDGLNAKLSAWQTRINGLKTGTDEWRGAADMVRKYSYELEKTNQLLDNYKAKSLRGLKTNDADARVKDIENFQKGIRAIDEEMNRMSANGSLFEKDGSVSKAALQNIEERARLEGELNKLTTTGTDLVKQKMEADKRAAEQSAASANKQIEANRRAGLERQRILNAEENNIAAVTAKLQLRQKQLNEAKTGTGRYAKIESEVIRLTAVLNRMQAVQQAELAQMQNELKTVRQLAAALRSYGDTIGQIQTKLSAFQTALNNSKVGGDAFREAALQIKAMNEELSRANQMAQNYQSKAFFGLNDATTQGQVNALKPIQAEITKLTTQYNELNANKQAFDAKGNLTPAALSVLAQLNAEYEKQNKILRDVDSAMTSYKQKIEAEEKELKRLIEAEAKRKKHIQDSINVMQANENRIDGLNAKLQRYQQLISKLEMTDSAGRINPKWSQTAAEIRRLSEELVRANQQMRDFQNAAFKGLSSDFTTKQTDAVTNLRREIDDLDKKFNTLYQNGRATNADGTYNDKAKALLDERIAKEKEISKILTSAADAALKREQELKAATEKRKKLLDDMRAKEKEHDAAKGERRALAIAEQRRKAAGGMTKEQEKRQKLLNLEETTVNNIQKKLEYYQNKLNGQTIDSKGFNRTAKEIERLTKLLDEARRKIADLTGQSTSGASRQAANARKVSMEYNKQLGYIDRLIRRMMVYGSFSMIGNFLSQVREVTAQFELQKVSLGAILQDQNKANQLFSEIKSFALKSPVSILDLTKYTKQLAAYKIGYDELFETTKKLTDVSVGLGVSMDRVVLAYGQVRATGHLRASEIRQFTEMGVPIVEELAAKLTKMNGELVTAADVMDMVSKRGISFEMVKEVFDDMTSAGGIFYNMQEKQGNTLYGMWAKLSDAASVMYSEIGNTGWINSAMKTLIGTVTSLMKNWRMMIGEVAALVAGFGLYKLSQNLTTASTIAASKATRDYARAQIQLSVAQKGSIWGAEASAKAAMRAAAAYRAAAMSTKFWTAAKYRLIGSVNQLKAALAGNWITILITAIAAIGYALYESYRKANQLKNALNDIEAETISLQSQSVGRFEYLAEAAVNAANGSRQQRDALEELSRTYGDILPQDALKLENLRQLKHNYAELTTTLKEYIATQQMQKGLNDISETYGEKINKASTNLIDGLVSEMRIGRDVAAQIVGEMQRDYQETLEKGEKDTRTVTQRMIAAAKKFGVEMTAVQAESAGKSWGWFKTSENLDDFYDNLAKMNQESSDFENRMKGMAGASYEFQKAIEETKKKIESTTLVIRNQDGTTSPVDEDTMLGQQMKANATMKAVADLIMNDTSIQEAINNKEVEWNEGWIHLVSSVNPNDLMDITRINFDAIIEALNAKHPELVNKIKLIQKEWGNVAPTDATMLQINSKLIELTKSFDPTLQKMRQFLWDGAGTVDDYLEKLKDQQERLRALLVEKQNTLLNMTLLDKIKDLLTGHDLEAEIENIKRQIAALDKLVPFVTKYTLPKKSKNTGRGGSHNKTKGGGGTTTDNRLQNLQEIHQTLEKINKSYNELQKNEGKTKALADTKENFEGKLAYINKLGAPHNLKFDYPVDFKTLQQYRKQILSVMESLKKLNGAEKAIADFKTTIGEAEANEMQRQIEEKLKDISERISRTKTVREFYEKILDETGDLEFSARLSVALYGTDGRDLRVLLTEQLQTLSNGLDMPDDIVSPDNIINHSKLREWAEANKDELGLMYKQLISIADQGQKDVAKNIEGYMKDLSAAETYAAKRVKLARDTAEKIAEIERDIKAGNIPEDEGRWMQLEYRRREQREEGELTWDAFKEMPLYIQLFEDLENTSTATLEMMRRQLDGLSTTWAVGMNPKNLKEIVGRIDEIDEQLRQRNPWKSLRRSWKEYRDAVNNYNPKVAEERIQSSQVKLDEERNRDKKDIDPAAIKAAEFEVKVQQSLLGISEKVTAARKKGAKALEYAARLAGQNEVIARGELDKAIAKEQDAKKQYGDKSEEYKAAHTVTLEKKEQYDIARKVSEQTQNDANEVKSWKTNVESAVNEISRYLNMAGEAARAVADLSEAFGADEEDVQYWNDIADGLSTVSEGINDIMQAVMSGNITGIIEASLAAIPKMVIGFINVFDAQKIRNANKEIRRQEKLLSQLEYTYSRLENAAEKLFGGDYIRTYNREVNNLYQQLLAKQKQLEAEQSKGKKKDREAIDGYKEDIRDLEDEIADMRNAVSEQMLGSDLTSAARDFASAWLDAYKEFGNTTDAMSEKFNEMIENMVVEGLLAKVMESALKPAFDMIDNMGDGDFYNPEFWRNVVAEAEKATEAGNAGASTMMQFLQAAGLNLRELGGELEGISREVGGATSEEINTWGAALNTQNFYIAQQLSEVRAIRAWLEGGVSQTPDTTAIDYLELQNTALGHLAAIERHTAETVTECRNIAARCEEQASTMRRIVTTQGGASGVNVFVR